MVVGTILKFGGVAVGFVFFGLFASRAVQIGIGPAAKEVADSIGSFGKGIGEVGSGAASLGTGIGAGISGLFSPFVALFKLFNLGGKQATSTNNALNPATQPSTTQQSNISSGSTFLSTGTTSGFLASRGL